MQNNKNKIIVKNTIAQYIKTIVSVIVNIYAARIILEQLGIDDYGIYTAVASFVAIFGVINSSMVVSVQRFISCEIAVNNHKRVSEIYSTSLLTHIGIALLIILLAGTIGQYFIREYMVFAPGKLDDALFVFCCVLISFAVNVISIPQQAILISYEKIFLSSIIGIIESLLKLGIAFALMFAKDDKLILYAILFAIVSIIVRFGYSIVVKMSLPSLKFIKEFNKSTFKEVCGFAGWNFFGGVANMGKSQGVNILLNVFFGTAVNAAYGLAYQLESQLLFFATSIFQASNSQIVQSYKIKDFKRLDTLIQSSTKTAFFLFFIITSPLIIITDDIMTLWLGNVPEYCSFFVALMLINAYIELFSSPLMIITQATGRIKSYFISISSIMIMIIPLSYVALKYGADPYVVLYITIIINCILLIVRLWYVSYKAGVTVRSYIFRVIIPFVIIAVINITVLTLIMSQIHLGIILRIIICYIISSITTALSSYLIVLSSEERKKILKYGNLKK